MAEASGRTAVRRVAVARGISLAGSGAAFAALAYIVYRLTGESAVWLSVTLLLTMGVQGLVQPLASWLGDRFDRRRVLVASDLAAAAGFVALAFARTPGQLVAIACVTAILESPVWAVAAASIPNLVDDEHLPWANGQVAIGRHLGSFIGPLLGTQVVALLAGEGANPDELLGAGAVVFGLNAVTFVASAWLIGRTPGRFSDERRATEEHAGIRAGFRYAMSDRVLRAILIGWSVLLLGVGLILVAELPYSDAFGQGAFGYGLISALWGGGAALGAVFAARWLTAQREPGTLLVSVALGGLVMFAIGWSPFWVLALGLMITEGICEGFASVAEQGLLQRRTPDEVRSRVAGAVEAATLIALAISFTAGGPIVDWLGPRAAYYVSGVMTLIAALIMSGPMRNPGVPPHLADRTLGFGVPEPVPADRTANP
ncbi:MAG TPA: MFS transporter [Actinomycetota bacterium]|nr:MFS transporter [Actinomycetota bacterium]